MPPRENPLAYISNLTCLLAFEIAMIGHTIDENLEESHIIGITNLCNGMSTQYV